MSIKTYDKGEIIFKQGDFAEEMYDIISGSVGIYYGYGTENQIQLAVLRSNDFLGEMAMIETYPRSATAGIFAGGMGADIAYQGLMVSALTLLSFFVGHFMESGVWEIPMRSAAGTTMAFLTMSMAEIFHSFNMRSQRGSIFTLGTINWALWISLGAALLLTTGVCQIPAMAAAFSFTTVTLREYAVAIGLGALVIPIVEIVKFFQRRAAGTGQK